MKDFLGRNGQLDIIYIRSMSLIHFIDNIFFQYSWKIPWIPGFQLNWISLKQLFICLNKFLSDKLLIAEQSEGMKQTLLVLRLVTK